MLNLCRPTCLSSFSTFIQKCHISLRQISYKPQDEKPKEFSLRAQCHCYSFHFHFISYKSLYPLTIKCIQKQWTEDNF